ncbi:MAG: phosphatase PAP2 family protein [Paracoccaceae bacterium]|jgi:hypothetical protein
MMGKPVDAIWPQGLPVLRGLAPAERLLLGLILTLGAASVMLSAAFGRVVDWAGFLPGIAAALAMIAVGAHARGVRNAPRLGGTAIGIGLFMGFTAFASIFIFALFPLPNPLIDSQLISVDAALGYDWAGFVVGLAEYPLLARGLGYLYHSSLPQMVLVIILLGVLRRELAMHRFLLVGMMCMTLTVGVWWLWPSIGPSAFASIPAETAARIGLVVNPAVGAHLQALVEVGPGVIGPETVMGVVAFPSYHIIMALMVVWYSRATFAFWPFALAGLGMVPATLAHGGHHLVDLLAGGLVFAGMVWAAGRMIPGR